MSFTAQHYQCCSSSGDASMDKQNEILAAIAAVGTLVADIDSGGGTASEAKQDTILAELSKLTRPTMG